MMSLTNYIRIESAPISVSVTHDCTRAIGGHWHQRLAPRMEQVDSISAILLLDIDLMPRICPF